MLVWFVKHVKNFTMSIVIITIHNYKKDAKRRIGSRIAKKRSSKQKTTGSTRTLSQVQSSKESYKRNVSKISNLNKKKKQILKSSWGKSNSMEAKMSLGIYSAILPTEAPTPSKLKQTLHETAEG